VKLLCEILSDITFEGIVVKSSYFEPR